LAGTGLELGKKAGADKATATAQDDATTASPLRSQVDSALASPPKPADKTREVAEKPTEAPKDSGEPDDPYTHTNRVKALTTQLDQLTASGKKPDEVITVDNKQVKVKDFVKDVKGLIKTELEAAKKASAAINQETVGTYVNSNIADKNALSQKLGLDPKVVSPELLQAERVKAANNPERRTQIDQLDLNLQERAAMEALRHAPAYVKLLEAEVTAKGFARPELALGQEVSADDTRKAFELLKLAGNEDADLKATDIYAKAELSVGMTFASFQQERSQKIIELMRTATEAGNDGKKHTVTIDGKTVELGQEDLLKEANKLADKINVGWVASQAMLQRNQENGTATELMNIVTVASFARLDYVNFMSTHGQITEAQKLFTQVKADTPHLIYNPDGSYRDQSLQTLDTKLTLGVNTDGADYQSAQSRFLHAIEKGNINADPAKPGESATELLDQMKVLNQQFKQEMEASNKEMQTNRQDLLKRQLEMEKQTTRSDAENVELGRLKREIEVIDSTMQQRTAYFDRRENLGTYMEGSWLEAKEDFSAAHKKYKEFDSKEQDAQLKKDLDIEGKTDRTQGGFAGWWHRNNGYIAVGAAVVVAAAVTVGTLGAGSVLGAGLVGTALLATAAGTAGGAGAHWMVERTVNKDAGWDSAWKGAKIGLMTSGMIVAPWATGARAAGATAVAAGGEGALATSTAVAANTTNIGRALGMARTVGLTKSSLATGYGIAAVTEGGDYALGHKSAKDAAVSFGIKGLFGSMMIGQAAKWGAVSETAIAANAAKSTIPNAIGFSGKNAAMGYSVSGVMEGYNYFSGQKTLGDATKDFVVGGAANTLTLGVLRKYGLSDTVGRAATANLQNTRYAAQAILLNESFGAANDIVNTQYISHDILGRSTFANESGASSFFISPLASDFYRRNMTNGLNPLHSGELKRFRSNLDAFGDDLTSTIGVDQKFIRPYLINQNGIFDQPAPQTEQR